ncbi:MAG: family 20 glycosylhydrolase [Clostridia bacterium]|nr:family 20 glycosylhydrolase [Clostridia bacterium]
MNKNIKLCPAPKSITYGEGIYLLDKTGVISVDSYELMQPVIIAKKALLGTMRAQILDFNSDSAAVKIKADAALGEEKYVLDITESGVIIRYGTKKGAFFGLMTLNQLVEVCGAELPCLHITDSPEFKVRGYMLDVARCKIPKLETIYHVIDILASLKYNQFQLYMEGVPFEYPSFPNMTKRKELLTGEELFLIDKYCAERMIEMVPCQNHFGHMGPWVEKEYNHLAECPDGFDDGPWGFKQPSMLDPADPGSLELVTRMADDLLPYFSSNQFNINCDETFELGRGKSKEECERIGNGRVYLNYILKLHKMAAKRGKKILLWGDIIKKFPDLISELPEDVTVLEWGYDDTEPTEESCQIMQNSGVKYIVCPGTNTWNSIIGRNATMINNIRTAAVNGKKYGAEGILCTDWGDNGHYQPLSVSYAGAVWSAAMSWNTEASREEDIPYFLDKYIFKDANGVMGQLAIDAGCYNLKEYQKQFNITAGLNNLFNPLEKLSRMGDVDESSFNAVLEHFAEIRQRIKKADLKCVDADIIREEFDVAIDMTAWTQLLGLYYVASLKEDTEKMREYLDRFVNEGKLIISRFKVSWLKRNKYSYLDESLESLQKSYGSAVQKLKELED